MSDANIYICCEGSKKLRLETQRFCPSGRNLDTGRGPRVGGRIPGHWPDSASAHPKGLVSCIETVLPAGRWAVKGTPPPKEEILGIRL
jgi:hypothetical protein